MSQKIKVYFDPSKGEENLESGVINSLSWKTLLPCLEKGFAKKDNERIVGFTVTEYGIMAKFENIPE